VVAEIHKGKYIYYRCTHNMGQKCPDKYVREEIIHDKFKQSLGQLTLDVEVVEWIVKVMGQATVEQAKQQETQVNTLGQQKQRLEDRLERMYLDKLDGAISEDEYKRLSNKFRSELSDVKVRMDQLKEKNEGNLDSAKAVLELAQKAASLYSTQIPAEKRRLLNSVYSNSSWAGGELTPNFRKPFDIIAVSNGESGMR